MINLLFQNRLVSKQNLFQNQLCVDAILSNTLQWKIDIQLVGDNWKYEKKSEWLRY